MSLTKLILIAKNYQPRISSTKINNYHHTSPNGLTALFQTIQNFQLMINRQLQSTNLQKLVERTLYVLTNQMPEMQMHNNAHSQQRFDFNGWYFF